MYSLLIMNTLKCTTTNLLIKLFTNSCSSTENTHENPEQGKVNKKLSKKSSFFKNLSFDIFRSKTSKKVLKHHSLCEYDLKRDYQSFSQNDDNALNMSNSDYGILSSNTRKLLRSNSSCEKRPLKPILKRQSSFCENRSSVNPTECSQNVHLTNTRRRQNSMCEIETEPKIKPLRRQNSMIEYRRNDDYRIYSKNFNMITKIDPLYQRTTDIKASQKCYDYPYQNNPHTYNMGISNSEYKHPSDFLREKLLIRQTQCPYSSRKDVIQEQNSMMKLSSRQFSECSPKTKTESDYACCQQMNDNLSPNTSYCTESPIYKQSPYATKEELLRGRSLRENIYSTKEEILSDRFNHRILSSQQNNDNLEIQYSAKDELKKIPPFENPYQTKQELLLHRIYSNNSIYESLRNKKSHDDESKHSTNIHKVIDNMTEDLEKTTLGSEHLIDNFHNSMSAENDSENNSTLVSSVVSECICEDISTSVHQPCSKYGNPVESMYVSRQEILSQKAAMNKDPKCSSPNNDKLEMIKLRNLAKKEKIYQTKLECNSSVLSLTEPIYVSKRVLRDPVIYESQESKDASNSTKKGFGQDSPYDLSDNAHLSRRESLYQSKQEAISENPQPSIDFNTLRNSCDINNDAPTNIAPNHKNDVPNSVNPLSQAKVCNSETSINTNCESLCSMQFLNKPQSTPYTSQDFNGTESISLFKCNNRKMKNVDQNVPNPPNSFQLDMSVLAVGQKGKIDSGTGSCTTWGIFDNEGGTLEDRVWGVSLDIPPDAILSGVKQKIYFTVTDPRLSNSVGGPPIDMDKGK